MHVRRKNFKNFKLRSEKSNPIAIRDVLHHPRNIIAVVTRMPDRLGDYISNDAEAEVFKATLKVLIEIHPTKITGLSSSLVVEFVEAPLPGGGGMREDITSVTQVTSSPAFQYKEKYGTPITNFFTHFAEVSSSHYRDFNVPMTFDVMFFEPDPTNTMVVRAWHQKDMRFVSMIGTPGPVRDLSRKRLPHLELTCQFGGTSHTGLAECREAQELLEKMNVAETTPRWTDWNLASFPAQAK